jgi:succinyl-diaminopimelate desuccinylase
MPPTRTPAWTRCRLPTKLLTALYAHNDVLKTRLSSVAGITHPYLNVGRIEGGSNTNVVPGKVVIKLDRRMIPEEDSRRGRGRGAAADRTTVARSPGVQVEIKRLLLAHALQPQTGNAPLVQACRSTARPSSASPSPPRARRCTPTCGCTARAACRR